MSSMCRDLRHPCLPLDFSRTRLRHCMVGSCVNSDRSLEGRGFDGLIKAFTMSIEQKLPTESIMRFAWCLLWFLAHPKPTSPESRFDPCYCRELKVREVMEATRMGAALFPCIVSKVFMPYKPPAAMILAMQKFICVMVNFCFVTQLTGRPSVKEELNALANCHTTFVNQSLNLGLWEFYKLPKYHVEGYLSKEDLLPLMTDTFKCFEGLSLAQLKETPEISLNVFRFIIEKTF